MDISESRQVRVSGEHGAFVFQAEPDDGRLVIRREDEDGAEQVCAITIQDRDELRGFLTGLRRVLGIEEGQAARSSPQPVSSRASSGRGDESSEDEDDREERIRRARKRNPKAFAPWSKDEERRVVEAAGRGDDLGELARELGRSERAVRMRLEKLGVDADADNVVEMRRTG